MKNLVFIVLFISTFTAFAQPELPIDPDTDMIIYKEIVDVDSINKDQLYKNAIAWISIKFKSAKDVIQLDDAVNHRIIAKGNFDVYAGKKAAGIIKFTLKIDTKDNKYKYEFTDLYHAGNSNYYPEHGPCEDMIKTKDRVFGISYQKQYNKILTDMDETINRLIGSLKDKMTEKEEDW
jgi:hypothetical protein